MPQKTLPDFRVLAYPSDGLPRCVVTPFSHCDQMSELIVPRAGEHSQLGALTPNDVRESLRNVHPWAGQDDFVFLGDWIRFVKLGALDEGPKNGAEAAAAAQKQAQQREDGFGEISGFALGPTYVPLHFRMNDFDPARDPRGTSPINVKFFKPFRPLVWRALRGVPRTRTDSQGQPIPRKALDLRGKWKNVPTHWDSIASSSSPRVGRVFHSCHTPDDYVAIETQEKWPANQAFFLNLDDLQVADGQKGQAAIRVEFGEIYSLVLRNGEAPVFEKRVGRGGVVAGVAGGNPTLQDLPESLREKLPNGGFTPAGGVQAAPQWNPVSLLGRSGVVQFGQAQTFRLNVERLAGRFRFTIRLGEAPPAIYDVIDRIAHKTPLHEKTHFEPKPAAWKAARIKVFFSGLSGHLGGGEILFVNPALTSTDNLSDFTSDEIQVLRERAGTAKTARIVRTMDAPGRLGEPVVPTVRVAGWDGDGTQIEVETEEVFLRTVGRGVQSRALGYSIEMRASFDGMDTPLLTMVSCEIPGVYEQPNRAPLDITAACTRGRLATGQPPEVPSSELTLSIDRTILNGLTLPPYDGAILPGDHPVTRVRSWRDYVAPFKRITFEARWNYDDDSQDPWQTLFDGWVYSPADSTGKILEHNGTLTCRDGLMRLGKPWAFIDSTYRMGDAVYNVDRQQKPLYGAMLIYEILRVALGEAVARTLNGGVEDINDVTGMLRYFPRGHYPLIGNSAPGQSNDVAGWIGLGSVPLQSHGMPAQSKPMFPPPYRQNARNWIERIAKIDRAVFYWGYAPGGTSAGVSVFDRPVPIYARITELTKWARSQGVLELPDSIYSGQDVDAQVNAIVGSIEKRFLPERAINRVLVYTGQPPGGEGVMPTILAGGAWEPPGPLGDEDDGGDRTLLVEDDLYLKAASGMDRAVAESFLNANAALILNQFSGVKQEDVSIKVLRGGSQYFFGREVRPQMRAVAGVDQNDPNTADGDGLRVSAAGANAGSVSDLSMELDDKPLHIVRADHDFNFSGGADAWGTTLNCRAISATGL